MERIYGELDFRGAAYEQYFEENLNIYVTLWYPRQISGMITQFKIFLIWSLSSIFFLKKIGMPSLLMEGSCSAQLLAAGMGLLPAGGLSFFLLQI